MRSLMLAGLAVTLGLVFSSSAAAAECTKEFTGADEGQSFKPASWRPATHRLPLPAAIG